MFYTYQNIKGLGSLYGVHQWYWYLIAGLPAISGAMFPLFVYANFNLFKKTSIKNNNSSEITRMSYLLTVIYSYIIFHSMSPHKEFRFILPILPLICVLSGYSLEKIFSDSGEDERKRKRICYAYFLLLNFPHLTFLARMHQAAPISVNKSIASSIEKYQTVFEAAKLGNGLTEIHAPPKYTVHYLMGCHSSPTFSHLHVSGVLIDARTLDCSPTCRANKEDICESDEFLRDPYPFVKDWYWNLLSNSECSESHSMTIESELECKIKKGHSYEEHDVPDFLVISEENAKKVMPLLNQLGLSQVSQFPHTLSEVSFVSFTYEYIILFEKTEN